ncbi:L-threonylcarbamoyladenylate synthase [Parachlamydia sp. AcF125]|uniref:L-threonylcarbamoyladenylate synthase n=1 Tax=Parachlamydia sp. AcF125 TaxID=2795736 RepID=UPI001BC98031|nr:L-threonylcarbamoyladenylate synthase [Parachlamydia sp. AcF125]MBS4168074.1 Threonylcarbamoyl-AMP synthase [Parachlamydia sp. AcF125]
MRVLMEKACELLSKGEVVGLPTETVYGLAASLSHPQAINRIFTLKNRPADNPLIIHLSHYQQVQTYADSLPPYFELLAEHFWPGPLTLVLPIRPSTIPPNARAGLMTAAFRIPNHALTQEVIKKVGPLVMPSANLSGKPSATQVHRVEEDFGVNFPVLDGGKCTCGLESTILYFTPPHWEVVRLGSLAPEQFQAVLGYLPAVRKEKNSAKPLCPGQMYRHYAPKAELVLDPKTPPESIGYVLGFSDRQYPRCQVFSLGKSDNPQQVAENLYNILRSLDDAKVQRIWVDSDFPQKGLWLTISERLKRASCPSSTI